MADLGALDDGEIQSGIRFFDFYKALPEGSEEACNLPALGVHGHFAIQKGHQSFRTAAAFLANGYSSLGPYLGILTKQISRQRTTMG